MKLKIEVPCERDARAEQAAFELFDVVILLANYLNFCSGKVSFGCDWSC